MRMLRLHGNRSAVWHCDCFSLRGIAKESLQASLQGPAISPFYARRNVSLSTYAAGCQNAHFVTLVHVHVFKMREWRQTAPLPPLWSFSRQKTAALFHHCFSRVHPQHPLNISCISNVIDLYFVQNNDNLRRGR